MTDRTLDVGRALREGFDLVVSRNGLAATTALFLSQTVTLLLVLAGGTLYLPLDQAAAVSGSSIPVGSELPGAGRFGATVLAGLFGTIVSVPISIVVIRTFVVGATDRIPDDCLFERIGRATVSGIAVQFLVSLAVGVLTAVAVGTALAAAFVIQGVLGLVVGAVVALLGLAAYAAVWVHLLFVIHEVAVRGRGVAGAIRGSYATVRGNRLKLLVLGVALTGIQTSVGWAIGPAFERGVGPASLASLGMLVVFGAVSAAFSVVAMAVLARTYRQLSPDDRVRSGTIVDPE